MNDELAARLAESRRRLREIHAHGLAATAALSELNERLILECGIATTPRRTTQVDRIVSELMEAVKGYGSGSARAAESVDG